MLIPSCFDRVEIIALQQPQDCLKTHTCHPYASCSSPQGLVAGQRSDSRSSIGHYGGLAAAQARNRCVYQSRWQTASLRTHQRVLQIEAICDMVNAEQQTICLNHCSQDIIATHVSSNAVTGFKTFNNGHCPKISTENAIVRPGVLESSSKPPRRRRGLSKGASTASEIPASGDEQRSAV